MAIIKTLLITVIPLLILIISFAIFNYIVVLEKIKVYQLKNYDKCLRIPGAVGIEDLFEYRDVLIGGSDDRLKLWEFAEYGPDKTEDGSLVVIDPVAYNIIKKPIIDFPKQIAFHPHGIYIYKNLLYVINHAYHKGGERIEVIEITGENITDIEFTFKKSLILSTDLMGIANDIAVIGDDDDLYLTSYLPFSDPIEGRQHKSFLKKLLEKLCWVFKFRFTYIYYCTSSRGTFKCVEVPGTSSMMNNGIAFDYVNKIYASNPLEKRIRVFEMNPKDMTNLKFVKDIDLGYGGDNVYFSNTTKEVYIGALGQNYHHLSFIKDSLKSRHLPSIHNYVFGAVQVDTKENDKVKVLTMFKNSMLGVSSAIKFNNSVFTSSWADDGILVCKIIEN